MVELGPFAASDTSQFGENGILEKIFETIGAENKTCIEFGAYDLEFLSNVYPLWSGEGWKALLLEGDAIRVEVIRDELDGRGASNVTLLHRTVGARGPNSLDKILARHDVPEHVDLLSIDVDGMDYHIWRHLTEFIPRVVVIEHNPTIPPWKHFIGSSNGNNVGASLRANLELGNEKGYDLVAVTPVNGIFVRRDESAPFENKNNINELWDRESHATGIRYAMRTYDAELFFDGRPTHDDRYKPVGEADVKFDAADDVHFADLPPHPDDVLRYFITYPLSYAASRLALRERLEHFPFV